MSTSGGDGLFTLLTVDPDAPGEAGRLSYASRRSQRVGINNPGLL